MRAARCCVVGVVAVSGWAASLGGGGGVGWAGQDALRPPRQPRLVFVAAVGSDGRGQVVTMRADGSDLVRLRTGGDVASAALSPDGTRIAYAVAGALHSSLFVMDADGTRARRVTGGEDIGEPAWSPDGRRLVAVVTRQRRDHAPSDAIIALDASGARQRTIVRSAGAIADRAPAWSPDGTTIALVRGTPSRQGVYLASAIDGHGLRRLTPARDPRRFASTPAFSSDGRVVAYAAGGLTGRSQLFVVDARGGRPRQVTREARGGGVASPLFAPGDLPALVYEHAVSSRPYYRTDPRSAVEIRRVDLATGRTTTLRRLEPAG
jgi:Tol biopolymer transport system component